MNYDDAATWTKCNDSARQLQVEHRPEQIEQFRFPKDSIKESSRLFTTKGGSLMELQHGVSGYCIQSQRTLYFAFVANYSAEERVLQILSCKGSRDWKNIAEILVSHERNTDHLESFHTWTELELRLKNSSTIDIEHLQLIKQEENYYMFVFCLLPSPELR